MAEMLRGAAVPAPTTVHHAVRVAVTRSRQARQRKLLRRALSGLLAASLVFGVAVTAFVATRPAAPETPLAAAWSAYEEDELALDTAIDPQATLGTLVVSPDLGDLGLEPVSTGGIELADREAVATEYFGDGGERLAVFRWRGELPDAPGGTPASFRPELQTTSWGPAESAWWARGDVVYCAVGNLEQPEFRDAVERLQQASAG